VLKVHRRIAPRRASWDKAAKAGLNVKEISEGVKGADFVMMLMPDEHIAAVYKSEV